MNRFGQVLTMREEGLLFTRVEEELLRILKRWAAQQDGELSPYQKGPQPWRGVLKMLSDTGSGRGVAQQFQRAHREYSRAGDEAGRQNLEYRLKEAWDQARRNYKYNIGRRTNAFGNLSRLAGPGRSRLRLDASSAAQEAVRKGVNRFWFERVREMLTHIASGGNPNQPRRLPEAFISVTVNNGKDWPLAGSIVVTTESGKKWKLMMRGRKFVVVPVRSQA